MFEIGPVAEVAIPCRIVVVRVSGEVIIVNDSGCGSIDRSRGDIDAAVDGRTVEIRPVIDRESYSYATNPYMTKTGAGIYL